jgi:pentose-5-phosphate-3-epimerase/fructose/tagatose bisphosphate aldolase
VLGANIYDIRARSLDCRAYLTAAAERGTPIVLQASLNALGQAEEHGGTLRQGYLRPKDGAHDLVDAAMNAVRDVFLEDGQPPALFGIGLDHVDVAQDHQRVGRAARFFSHALSSGLVTHYVADGSALFAAPERSRETLELAFERVASFAVSLFRSESWHHLIDVEVCCGELNYCEGSSEAIVPTPEEMELFAQVFHRVARAEGFGIINVRPTLFIGNLGTIHHGEDSGSVKVELSKQWLARLKRRNFVSAVLHGTTRTTPDVLARAAIGCHKINVAGDFLATLVAALPTTLRNQVSAGEPKRRLADIYGELDRLPAARLQGIGEALYGHCSAILDTIRTPRLSSQDQSYFRYIPYHFTDRQVAAITRALAVEFAHQAVNGTHKPTSDEIGYEFAASMIEVPFDDDYGRITGMLCAEGIRYFHIDAGDGRFIPRVIDALDKVRHLREHHPEAALHAHLMVEDPHVGRRGRPSPIDAYIDAGCNAIAIHPRALTRPGDLKPALAAIRARGARPGLIIETSETIDEHLWTVICENDLDWSVVMGVPVGYGGQIFNMSTLQRLSALNHLARRDGRRFLIEVDGGLTVDNISQCQRAGAQIFAGWSIVRAPAIDGVRDKVRALRAQIAAGGKA